MKDTTNKIDYNIWTGTDYNNTTSGFVLMNNSIIQQSNDFSSIGESSLKCMRTDNSLTRALRIMKNGLTGTTNITVTFDVYTPHNTVYFDLNDGNTVSSVNVPISANMMNITLSGTTTKDTIGLYVILSNVDDYFYIDNIKISY